VYLLVRVLKVTYVNY